MGSNKEQLMNKPKRIWRKGNNPYRSLAFWGWNEKNDPSFLILYGTHEFKEENSCFIKDSYIERYENILHEDVTYTSYVILNGREGHLPSFEAVNIVEEGGWDYDGDEDDFPKMYYKKDSRVVGWSRNLNEEGVVKEYKKLDEGCGITIPYFEEVNYSELVHKVISSNIDFGNFKFAKNPNEILQLDESLKYYFELLCVIMSNKNLYMRKKKLKELMDSCKDKKVYDCIFKIGSNELLSGLLLEGAKRNIKSFDNEAKYILNNDINYAEDTYVRGLKRCARIYLNSIDEDKKKERQKWIYDNLEKIDLPLIKIDDKEVPEGKIFNGAVYRKLSYQSKLCEYSHRYEQDEEGEWQIIKLRNPDRYAKGPFNDGLVFNIQAFKNILQEAETYNMADVIGRIAYFIDAPRLHYYFQGNSLGKALRYFKRYIRRILMDYAKNDPDKFMEAVKVLFTSYTEDDFICKFKGNFQFNYFIKNILYFDFKEKPPVGWDNWVERFEWMKDDQLLALQGRYEYMKGIWDDHLEDVIYIASNAHINTVLKACYFILKESDRTTELFNKMSYDQLINLTKGTYEPLAEMYMESLENKLNNEEKFDFNIMYILMNNDNEDIVNLAIEYFKRCDGHLSADNVVSLMLLDNIEKWAEFICEIMCKLDEDSYVSFIKCLIEADIEFKKKNIEMPKEITDVLSESVNKVKIMDEYKKKNILDFILSTICKKGSMEGFLEKYAEEVVFALSYSEIKKLMVVSKLEPVNKVSSRIHNIINLLRSIVQDEIPKDSVIITILENGTSKSLKTLFEIIDINENELRKRFSTMLLLLESDVLMLNEKAKDIFENMDDESKITMHKLIIDSPIEKVYDFGLKKLNEIYGDIVPAEFIMQMMEHTSPKVKSYISKKTDSILESFGQGNKDLFMYYAKTLLMLPNRVRKSKDNIYDALYDFAVKYDDARSDIEELLLKIGGSNIKKDSEKALVILAKIRKEEAV